MTSRFRFISTHRAVYGVKRLCRILAVSRSGFYRWTSSEPARQEQAAAEDQLAEQIAVVHADSGGTYGSPRVTVELRAQGVRVNHKRVARVMRERGIVGRHLRRRKRTTICDPAAAPVADLLGRDFTATAPDQRWCGDITYLRVGTSWLFLATVIDIATRRLIGWSINTHMRTGLVIDAMAAAVTARGGQVDGVIFHTDKGVSTAAAPSPPPATVTQCAGQPAGPARPTTTPSPRHSSPPSNANSTSTTDTGRPRPTPAGTCSAGSPSTTTADVIQRSAISAPPTTNEGSHRLPCNRSRHNPVSTSRGEAQLHAGRLGVPAEDGVDASRRDTGDGRGVVGHGVRGYLVQREPADAAALVRFGVDGCTGPVIGGVQDAELCMLGQCPSRRHLDQSRSLVVVDRESVRGSKLRRCPASVVIASLVEGLNKS